MERIALIDLGSNTARLVIYDVHSLGHFIVTYETRESVRLGDTEPDGNLKQTRIMQAVGTLKSFKQICAVYSVDRIIAITTAAVRQANNQRIFLTDVFNATGIRFSILSEDEEANYVYQGIINSMDIPRGVIMEIGGGSIKLIHYNRRVILHTKTFEFGALTLSNMFMGGSKSPEQCSDDMVDYFAKQLAEIDWLKELDEDTQLIGVGGSYRNLARIVRKVKKYPLDLVHNYSIGKSDFDYVYNMIRSLDNDKKRRIKGLSAARADVFPAALAVIKAFADYVGFDNIVTSGNGLREGVMYNHCMPITKEKPLSDITGQCITGLLMHTDADIAHAEQRFALCIQLFKQLRVLHKFPRTYVKPLRIAALMYDVGRSFKCYNHCKHTSYMILNSKINGASHRDIVMASCICDVYNKEDNSYLDWTKYSGIMSTEDFDAVKKLAVMLLLADDLDISRNKAIVDLTCDVLGDSVIMKTEVNGDASLELKYANNHIFEFKKVFKKNLEIL